MKMNTGLLAALLTISITWEPSSFAADFFRKAKAPAVPSDIVLQKYKSGLSSMRRGDSKLAKADFDEAIGFLNSVRSGTQDAKKARSIFGKESAKFFLGEPYERVMAFYYRGIIYWMDGEIDNARACFRSGQIADADAGQNEYKADYVLLDYLDALATARLGGDHNSAFQRSQSNTRTFDAPPAIDPTHNVFVFLEFGNGPTKYATGDHQEELRFKAGSSTALSAKLTLGAQSLTVRPYDDLSFQASTRGGRVMDHILANKVTFKENADAVGDVAALGTVVAASTGNSEAAAVGVGLTLISKGLSAAAKPAADTRCWDNLPQFLSFGGLKRDSGADTLSVEFFDANGTALPALKKTIHLPNRNTGDNEQDIILFVSELP